MNDITPKLEYSPHQAEGLYALLCRQQELHCENTSWSETVPTNSSADNTELTPISGDTNCNDL